MLPQLRKLERRYADELAVVSVHSPKFPTERETPALRQAVLRHRIEHPVLNDRDFMYWRQFGARAWPTMYFIDPRGNVIGRHEGEISADAVAGLLDAWIADYRRDGALLGAPLPLEAAGRRGGGGGVAAALVPRQGALRRGQRPAVSSPTATTTASSRPAWTGRWSR